MKKLENLRWQPRWVSHLGCIEGALRYLNRQISPAWLYGATGHAFIINIGNEVCPSGPTAWNTKMLFDLSPNVGYRVDGVTSIKTDRAFSKKQKEAWNHVQIAIDAGWPCYGWELEEPEFYIIYGYDKGGYYFSGPLVDDGKGPKPWKEVGATKIGILEIHSIQTWRPPPVEVAIREAFNQVMEHAKGTYILPHARDKYKAGIEGYDKWIEEVEAGTATSLGMAYNAAVWSECRIFATEFLKEAQEWLGPDTKQHFEEAIGYYDAVSRNLVRVSKAYPFSPELNLEPIKKTTLSRTTAEDLRAAREAEVRGLQVIAQITKLL